MKAHPNPHKRRRITGCRILLFLVLACSSWLPAAHGQSQVVDDPRIVRLQHQVETVRDIVGTATNTVDRAPWERRLAMLEKDLTNLKRRAELAERAAQLAERQKQNAGRALQDLLSTIGVDTTTHLDQVQELSQQIRELRADRAELEEKLNRLQSNPEGEAEAIAETGQLLRNKDEEALLRELERGVAELRLRLVTEAIRIRDTVQAMPINPRPTIKGILSKRRFLAAEKRLEEEAAARLEGLEERIKDIHDALELSRERFAQLDNEVELLDQKRQFGRDKEIRQLLYIARSENKLLEKRIDCQRLQAQAVRKGLTAAGQTRELYQREIAVLRQDLATLIKRYLTAVIVPLFAIAIVLMLHLLVCRALLPRAYDRNRLFVARRLTGYGTVLCVLLILAAFFLEDLKAIATVLGIAGAALVIALQDLCSSFAGWFVIVASRKVRVGDRVEIDGQCGDVIDIQLLRTTLLELNNWLGIDEPTGRVLIVPNSFIFKSKILNYSHIHPFIWNRTGILVTFETPAEEAYELLRRILKEETVAEFEQARDAPRDMERAYGVPDTTYEPKINSEIGDSGVLFNLIYISHYTQRSAVRTRINKRIIEEFGKNPRMDFAYPTERHIPTAEAGGFPVAVNRPDPEGKGDRPEAGAS